MQRTSMRLADGRELIYFDDTPGARRRLDDARDLAPATTLSELRYDAVLDEWVTIALVAAESVEHLTTAVTAAYAAHGFRPPEIFTADPGPGASRVL